MNVSFQEIVVMVMTTWTCVESGWVQPDERLTELSMMSGGNRISTKMEKYTIADMKIIFEKILFTKVCTLKIKLMYPISRSNSCEGNDYEMVI